MRALARVAALTAAAIVTVASATAAPASAQPGGNVVVFGDSFASNPDQYRDTALKFFNRWGSSTSSTRISQSNRSQAGCLQGPNNWPSQLDARTHSPVADWSCTGHRSKDLPGHVDHAIRAGALNRHTRAVTFAVGINDQWRPFIDGESADPQHIRARYFQNIKDAAAKVRAVAPDAHIIIPGLLPVTGGGQLCLINVVPNAPLGVPAPRVAEWEQRAQNDQREAARLIGATFIDIRALSAGHSTCAKDADRWVAGIIDTTTPGYNMVLHPSNAGSAFVADQVAQAL